MKIKGFNLFKIESSKQPTNPISQEGVKALGVVLAVIVVIAVIVYTINSVTKGKPAALPPETEVKVTPQPTLTQILMEAPILSPIEIPVEMSEEELTPTPEETPISLAVSPTVTMSPAVTE